jgi:hypothetical protein
MIEAFFSALGNVFATGVGILLLGALTGALFVLWDWRAALVGAVLVHLGACSILVLVHDVPGLVAAGQMLAITLAAAMLASAGILHPNAKSLHQAGNWPLRLMALVFVVVAWWYLDPGYTLPYFSQPETEFLLWTGICALAMWSFSGSPLMGGAAVLLWSTPMYALASVLLPGSGLAAIIGIVDIILALACSYLVLLEPAGARGASRNTVPHKIAAVTAPLQRRAREALAARSAASGAIPSEPIQKKATQ